MMYVRFSKQLNHGSIHAAPICLAVVALGQGCQVDWLPRAAVVPLQISSLRKLDADTGECQVATANQQTRNQRAVKEANSAPFHKSICPGPATSELSLAFSVNAPPDCPPEQISAGPQEQPAQR